MKKVTFIIIIIASVFVINNLIRSIYSAWQKKDLVTKAEQELVYQKQENQKLKAELSYAQTQEFVERQARDKLFMVRKGEKQVLAEKQTQSNAQDEKKEEKPNWRKWLELFL